MKLWKDYNRMSRLLTISIAAYNVEATIEKCLDSFLQCHYLSDLEILVINDGSHDRTAEIVSKYEITYPECIHLINKENGGHGSTLNKSLRLATGKFYKVVDGDDWVDPGELDKLCECLKATDADLVINSFKWCYPDKSFEEHDEVGYLLNHTYKFDDMYSVFGENTHIFPMTTITILTSKLINIGMHIKEKCFYADNEFVAFCAMAADTISFDSSCAYQYRMGSSTQSVNPENWYKHLDDYFAIFDDLTDIYARCLKPFEESKKEKYLLKFLEGYYNSIYMNMIDKVAKSDKDYMINQSVEKFKRKYPLLFKKIHLTSLTAYFVAKNPIKFIPLMRSFHRTQVFLFLRTVKDLLKSI